MNLIKVTCATCGKTFLRPAGRVNEARKFGWNQYCSKVCQNKSQLTRVKRECANPTCNKMVYRSPGDLRKSKSGLVFCSQSCAASFNNSKFPKRKAKVKICDYCGKEFKGGGAKYCSTECQTKAQIITKAKIIELIKEFDKENKRIPLKREFHHYNAARNRFGSWNRAIEAAGFESNPVKFSKKFIAKDDHICDSFAEKIIDDWLYSKNIEHQRNVPYPNSPYTADFLINGKFVEFFGLNGELKEYDKNAKLKEKLAAKYKLKLIKIYPKDLFPVNHLSEILRI